VGAGAHDRNVGNALTMAVSDNLLDAQSGVEFVASENPGIHVLVELSPERGQQERLGRGQFIRRHVRLSVLVVLLISAGIVCLGHDDMTSKTPNAPEGAHRRLLR
jgi:hypothetical protein